MDTLERVKLHEQLLELKLKHAEKIVDQLCHEATERQMSYTEVMGRLLEEELAHRRDRGSQLRIQLAHFPFKKTIEQFDFGFQPSIDQRKIEELSTLGFVGEASNVVLLGPPGVGKTHLAIGMGIKACLSGYPTYFISAHEVGRQLLASLADDTIEKKLFALAKYKLLIIDEMGYLPFESRQASLFFQLIARRYEHGSIIVTSNKSFGQWAEIFGGDAPVASAILDRLLHHCSVINIRGQSYRLKDRQGSLKLFSVDSEAVTSSESSHQAPPAPQSDKEVLNTPRA
jgi:DNA replication protein DnaC